MRRRPDHWQVYKSQSDGTAQYEGTYRGCRPTGTSAGRKDSAAACTSGSGSGLESAPAPWTGGASYSLQGCCSPRAGAAGPRGPGDLRRAAASCPAAASSTGYRAATNWAAPAAAAGRLQPAAAAVHMMAVAVVGIEQAVCTQVAAAVDADADGAVAVVAAAGVEWRFLDAGPVVIETREAEQMTR